MIETSTPGRDPAPWQGALKDVKKCLIRVDSPRRLGRISQAFGKPPRLVSGSPIDLVAAELLEKITR